MERDDRSTRRSFLRTGFAAAASLPILSQTLWGQPTTEPAPQFQTPESTREGDMLYRVMGNTGEKISLIGLGGAHIGFRQSEADVIKLVRYAVDHGITFMDNSWDYSDGAAETRMGKALQNGYRNKVFLMTKYDGRTKAAALRQIDESLQRLQTDHLDLIQFHENVHMDDPDRFFAAGGAVEAMNEVKKAGKARYIGFTGHKDPAIHVKMLEVATKNNYRFDAVQMPLNVMDAHFRSFERGVLPVLVKDQIGVLGMKSLGFGGIVRSGIVSAVECLQYAMNLPTSTVITGMETIERVDQALGAVKTFKPMTAAQVAALLARTKEVALTGRLEPFKTTGGFDGTTRHPEWMG